MKCVLSEEWSKNVRCLSASSSSFAFMFTTSVNVWNICASLFIHVCVHDVVSVQWQYVRIKMILKKTNNFVDQSLPKYEYGI